MVHVFVPLSIHSQTHAICDFVMSLSCFRQNDGMMAAIDEENWLSASSSS
jgi:hypothetical protein